MATTTLRTPRLTLRAAQLSDLDDFFEIFSNGDVMQFWSTAPHTSILQTHSYLSQMIASPTNGVLDFVMEIPVPDSPQPHSQPSLTKPKAQTKVIGKLGLFRSLPQSPHGYEIGFMLHRSYWGKGYMIEAMATLLPHMWTQGVKKVVADVDPRNEGSIGVLKRFGFVETGREERTGSVEGVWFDSVYYVLWRGETMGGGGRGVGRRERGMGSRVV